MNNYPDFSSSDRFSYLGEGQYLLSKIDLSGCFFIEHQVANMVLILSGVFPLLLLQQSRIEVIADRNYVASYFLVSNNF